MSADLILFPCTLCLVVESRGIRALVPPAVPWEGPASTRSPLCWSGMQFKVSPGKAARSVAKCSPNRGGEFLKLCDSLVQVSCVFFPVCGSSHSKSNKGWLAGDSRRQKNASLRSRQVKSMSEPVRDSGVCKDLGPLDG